MSLRQHPLARTLVMVRTWPFVLDLGVAFCGLALFFAVLHIAHYWMGTPEPVVPISHSARALPLYAFYSIFRIGIAYLFSLTFAIAYGYTAARTPRLEAWMIAVLDVLQSIPVLSFLPPVVLAMVSLIPGRQLGIELGVILLIFTGQVWNLAFSFYSSLKSIPREMEEAARIFRYSAWQRFWQLEMPYASIGLVWNSIVSVAGGWFALMLCEMFTMGDRNFQLPGLGSYIQSAANSGDVTALLSGIGTVILIVVATDQLLWRPLIAWSDKFKFEQVESADRVSSPVLELIRRSNLLNSMAVHIRDRIQQPIYRRLARSRRHVIVSALDDESEQRRGAIGFWVVAAVVAIAGAWAIMQAVVVLRSITWAEMRHLLAGAAATFLRVNAALLISALWTIPAGVAIGFNPRLSRIVQPLAQVLASVPASAFYPILLIGLMHI
ncbi:MAG TPA: ABC transporter permease subunit, partial [Terracidiphilus sp.]|nr:ABC transporter permease subunit [Terracidiphilus sp.]